MTPADVKPVRPLPVGLIVRRSFSFAWESRAIFAAPYALYAGVTILADLLVAAVANGNRPAYVLSVIEEVFGMAFAVGVHRYVLLGEIRPGVGFFRFDRHFVQYILTALALFLMGVMVLIVPLGLSQNKAGLTADAGPMGLVMIFVLAGLIWAALTLCRLSLMLPAAAVGDIVPAKRIWQATLRNGFRLFAATLLVFAPFLLFEGLLVRLYPVAESAAGPAAMGFKEVILTVLVGLISPLQLIVVSIALALQYDILMRGGGPASNQDH